MFYVLDTLWMTWTSCGSCALSIPLLMLLKDDYRRLDIDDVHKDS